MVIFLKCNDVVVIVLVTKSLEQLVQNQKESDDPLTQSPLTAARCPPGGQSQ